MYATSRSSGRCLWLISTLSFIVICLFSTHVLASDFSMEAAVTAKIANELADAMRQDIESVEADIMVQLESTEAIIQRECGGGSATIDRAQKTTCMVDNLQSFADRAQAPVRALLDTRKQEYADVSFFWINNSVAVKKAKGRLILALAQLEAVVNIRPEGIFHTMKTHEDHHEEQQADEQPMMMNVMGFEE